nr:hypothetical protein [Tanacetum cinerariifolium]
MHRKIKPGLGNEICRVMTENCLRIPAATDFLNGHSITHLHYNEGAAGTILVMICRMWDVNSATGRYLSTNFIVSDEKGNLMHCTAQMDGDTIVRRSAVKQDGFARYATRCTPVTVFHIHTLSTDAVGYVTNVGRITTTRSGSKTLDFHLANNRGQSVRVTLWGGLGEMLIKKRTRHVGLYPVVLTTLPVKLYNNRLGIEIAKELLPADSTGAKSGTLKNLLMWARNLKYDAATFYCAMRVDKIITMRGWNYPSCGGEKCKKGNLDRKHGRFWCDSCHSSVDYPVLRLELEVLDDTAQTVVVMFDETARAVVKCSAGSIDEDETGLPPALANIMGTLHTLNLKSNSYYEHANYESFTCWRVVLEEALDESGSSRTLAKIGEPKAGVLVPLTTTP